MYPFSATSPSGPTALDLTGTSLELVFIGIILGVFFIILFYFYFKVVPAKEYLQTQAEEAGFERSNEYVRQQLSNKPRELSWRIFLYDDSKSIGLRFLFTSLLFLFIAGSFGVLMRISLTNPSPTIIGPIEYNVLMSEHATLMIYMFALGSALGMGFYLLPSHLKVKRDAMGVYTSIAFWLWLAGGIFILLSSFAGRWYFYPPLMLELTQAGGGEYAWLAVLGLELVFIGIMIAGVSIIKIIAFDRSDDIKLNQMSLYTWSILFTAIMAVSSAPPLMVGLGMMFYDYFNPIFFVAQSQDVLLYTILFWFWGHPIVYIAILPYFGLIYEILPKFSGSKIYSYSSGVWGLGLLLILSELVWGHHLLNSGLGLAWITFFTTMSFLVVIPSAITVFNWIGTLWTAKSIRMTVPMMFALNGIVDFIIGGITGVMQAFAPFNEQIHGTYWVTGHFHFIFIGITLGITIAAFYMLFPTFSGGRTYNVRLAKWHFYLTAGGSYLMAFAWTAGGFLGMPRAVAGYFGFFQGYQDASIIGGVIIGIGQLIFLYNIATSWYKAPSKSQDNAFEESNTGMFALEDMHTAKEPAVAGGEK